MLRNGTTTLIAALLLTWLAGCVSVPSVTVSDTARAICPTPLTASQALRIADALDRLPPGDDLDVIATQLERLDDAARICRGQN
jgi:TusA-related sulfurtransferase